ncbi:MAG: hypothetical protein WCK78_04480 [Paludibacter sp.]
MFEEDDDKDDEFFDDDELTEMEEWYDDNCEFFVRESRPITSVFVEVPQDVEFFYESVYCPAMAEIAPAVRVLIEKQYPSVKDEIRPKLVEYINWIAISAGKYLLLSSHELVDDQKEGVNLREKYPDFEFWVENYGRRPEPPVPNYSFADDNPYIKEHISPEIIREVAEESCIEETEYYHRTENRRKEYFDIVQSVVFKYYKVLEDLDYEGWIVYAANINEDYESYTECCDHIDTIIKYNFDEDDLYLDEDLFMEKLHIKIKEELESEQNSKENKKTTN